MKGELQVATAGLGTEAAKAGHGEADVQATDGVEPLGDAHQGLVLSVLLWIQEGGVVEFWGAVRRKRRLFLPEGPMLFFDALEAFVEVGVRSDNPLAVGVFAVVVALDAANQGQANLALCLKLSSLGTEAKTKVKTTLVWLMTFGLQMV